MRYCWNSSVFISLKTDKKFRVHTIVSDRPHLGMKNDYKSTAFTFPGSLGRWHCSTRMPKSCQPSQSAIRAFAGNVAVSSWIMVKSSRKKSTEKEANLFIWTADEDESLLKVTNDFKVRVFENLRCRLSTLIRKTSPFSKVSTLESVFENLRFQASALRFPRFSVDGRPKRISKYPFSNENGLMWTGPKSS